MQVVWAKLGNMRKAQDFVVFEDALDGNMIIQSDRSIGRIGKDGKGCLNIKGCYFMHLNRLMGAVDYEFPADFVAECKKACCRKGDVIGGSAPTGVVIFGGTE